MDAKTFLNSYFALASAKGQAQKTDVRAGSDAARTDKIGSEEARKERKEPSGTDSLEKDRGKSLGVSQVCPRLAGMVSDPTAPPTDDLLWELQTLVLAERTGGKNINDFKHYYVVATGQTVPNGTVTNNALTNVSSGAASNNRASDVLKGKTLTLTFSLWRQYTGDVDTQAVPPTIRFYVWRDKVPATPGTATATLATDANPPASNVIMWSRVGSSSILFNSCAILNPDTVHRYHIYKTEQREFGHKDTIYNGTTVEGNAYKVHHRWHFDLNDVEVSYTGTASSDPMINPIYFSYFSDFDYTSVNFTDTIKFVSDFKFEDKVE